MVLLLAATVIAYGGLANSGFIIMDDRDYILDNEFVSTGLRAENLRWAFTALHASNWHPITWISHMIDVELWGLSPAAHHLVNLAIHAANALLLTVVLTHLIGSFLHALAVAALFALHPLHVESVAWVSERKDVLSTFLVLLTMLAWLGFLRSGRRLPASFGHRFVATGGAKSRWGWYAVVIILFGLAVMAKPMVVTLPALLLLLDWWPLGRLAGKGGRAAWPPVWRVFLEKLPLALLAAGSSILTVMAQRSGGAIAPLEQVSLDARLANAAVSGVGYLGKALWPRDLSFFYPFPIEGIPIWKTVGALGLLFLICLISAGMARRAPFLATGWGWYLITLAPVSGVVLAGGQAMADRYTYLPLVGIFLAVVWGLGAFVSSRPRIRSLSIILATAVLLALPVRTMVQVSYWRSEDRLWGRALEIDPDNWLANNLLGIILTQEGKDDAALRHFAAVLRRRPADPDALNNMSMVMEKQVLELRGVGQESGAEVLARLGGYLLAEQLYLEGRMVLEELVAREPSVGNIDLLLRARRLEEERRRAESGP